MNHMKMRMEMARTQEVGWLRKWRENASKDINNATENIKRPEKRMADQEAPSITLPICRIRLW